MVPFSVKQATFMIRRTVTGPGNVLAIRGKYRQSVETIFFRYPHRLLFSVYIDDIQLEITVSLDVGRKNDVLVGRMIKGAHDILLRRVSCF